MTSPEGMASERGFECPVYQDLTAALEHAHSWAHSMRKFRKSMINCAFCDHFDRCPVIKNFRLAINIAVEKITREWQLEG